MALARAARTARATGFAFFSVAIHLSLVTLCVAFATPASRSHAASPELYDVQVEPPPLGLPHGEEEGKGLGSHVPTPAPPAPPPPDDFAPPPPVPPPDPEAIPVEPPKPDEPEPATDTPPSEPDDPLATGDDEENTGTESSETGDPTTPVGSENVPPALGSLDGVEGGQGPIPPPKPFVSPQYKGIIASWFRARFHVQVDPEQRSQLRVAATVSLSPDRRVVGFSLHGTSGDAAFDEAVRASLSGIQASGVALPPPPDESTLPSTFTTVYTPR